jgi:hypothetical protein
MTIEQHVRTLLGLLNADTATTTEVMNCVRAAFGEPEPAPDALLLDLGGVVFPSPVQSLRELSARSGRPAKELSAQLFLSPDWAALEEGRIDVPAFVERFRAAQSIDLGSWFEGMAKLQPHPEMVFWAADEV